jgi:hypothetical protein
MELQLTEWGRAAAGAAQPALDGLFLDHSDIAASLARNPLRDHLRVSENRHGLVVEARQHVGVLQLGPLRIRIRPKLPVQSPWTVVTYALGLDPSRRSSWTWSASSRTCSASCWSKRPIACGAEASSGGTGSGRSGARRPVAGQTWPCWPATGP